MKILFLTISDKRGASSRYRVYQYLPFIESFGFRAKLMPPLFPRDRGIMRWVHGIMEKAACVRAALETDVLFIQKRLFSEGFVGKLQTLGKRIVFDFDDSIFTSPKADWSAITRSRTLARICRVLEAADLVIVGNRFLKSFAEESGAKRVEVLPTPIDTSKLPVKAQYDQGRPTVGWIGSAVNHPYVDLLSRVLPPLSQEFQGLKLLMVSDRAYAMHGVAVENRPWSDETEARDIHDMDVGLMPLADNDWTRGKCALKALQYMSCGVPAVCSPVGANLEVIDDGRQGFLPRTDEEWLERLARLLRSSELRRDFGSQGRTKVETNYSLNAMGPRMVELLQSL